MRDETGPRRDEIQAAERRQADPGVDPDVGRAAAGDARAFERLYRHYVPMVHSLARRMASPEEADEVTQDVFVKVWQKLDTFRGDSAFATWLHRVAVNAILERRRGVKRRRDRFVEDELELERASHRPVPVAAAIDVEGALRHLPDGARHVFVLHDVRGYKHEEIAGMLGVTSGTSKSQLHRARMMLRERLSM
jgi:RNA polymerase sigma-70 factor (ECF subfamily)